MGTPIAVVPKTVNVISSSASSVYQLRSDGALNKSSEIFGEIFGVREAILSARQEQCSPYEAYSTEARSHCVMSDLPCEHGALCFLINRIFYRQSFGKKRGATVCAAAPIVFEQPHVDTCHLGAAPRAQKFMH